MIELSPAAVIGKATYHLHVDDADSFRDVVARMSTDGSRSPGCMFFNAAQDAADPSTFYLFEGWDNAESIAAFHGTDAFQGALGAAMALRITARDGKSFMVTGVEDVTMPS